MYKIIIKVTTGLLIAMGVSGNTFAEESTPAWVKNSVITANNPIKTVRNTDNKKSSVVDYQCLVEPHSLVEISTREEGIIDQLHAKRGDIVIKDQPLVKLESGLEEVSFRLAKSRARMYADIEAKKATLAYHKRQLKRINNLWEKKVISFSEKDKADTDVLLAKTSLNDARENMTLRQIEKDRAEHLFKKRTIFSPISGVVVQSFLDQGESVDDSKPIMSIAEVDPLNIEVILPVEQFRSVKVGSFAEVTPLISGSTTKKVKVVIVDRVIDAASNTFGVRLLLPNPDKNLPGGIRCKVKFLTN